jgi:hypothetical protein
MCADIANFANALGGSNGCSPVEEGRMRGVHVERGARCTLCLLMTVVECGGDVFFGDVLAVMFWVSL